MKTITKLFVAAVALFGTATAVNAKTVKNTDNNVSSDTETVTEHDMTVYGAPTTPMATNLRVLPEKSALTE